MDTYQDQLCAYNKKAADFKAQYKRALDGQTIEPHYLAERLLCGILDPLQFTPIRIMHVDYICDYSRLFVLEATARNFILALGEHIHIRADFDTKERITRPFTPVMVEAADGVVRPHLFVRLYDNRMSEYFKKLCAGDAISVRGPVITQENLTRAFSGQMCVLVGDVVQAVLVWLSQQRWYVSTSEVYSQTNIPPEGQGSDQTTLSWSNVGIAALLLGFNVILSVWLGLGLSTSLIIAALRCVGQLTLLGMILKQIFLTENPIYIFGMTLVLGVLAAFEVSYWRAKRQFPGMFMGALVSIMASALLVALFGNAYSLNMDPAYTAVKFIPTIGMLFGNCMIGVSIGMSSVMDMLDTQRGRVEVMLGFGASRWEVIRPVVVDALRAALLPTITNMGITGLISIPGVMTGWILGGADVLQAARYQQIILFMISAATASSTLIAVIFCASVLVDRVPVLRLDRIRTAGTESALSKAGIESSMSRAPSRLALLRATCRPKSELYLSRNASSVSSSPTACNEEDLQTTGSLTMLDSRLSGLEQVAMTGRSPSSLTPLLRSREQL
ncbi:hypothetical protein J3F80_003282 [Coemansia sp. RSA 2526]|nr:hypothetical protein J3F80_003282 [Coemansia sp. RSA 2526]